MPQYLKVFVLCLVWMAVCDLSLANATPYIVLNIEIVAPVLLNEIILIYYLVHNIYTRAYQETNEQFADGESHV